MSARNLLVSPVTTVTTDDWALLYSPDGESELYCLASDPGQERNAIGANPEIAREIHGYLKKFMRDTRLADHLASARSGLRL